MSKSAKINLIKPQLKSIIKPLNLANASAYGGRSQGPSSITAALGSAAIAKAKNLGKPGGLTKGVNAEEWVDMGRTLWNQAHGKAENSINAVCDTCSALVIYILRTRLPGFHGQVELVADRHIHHHFIVIDRAGDINDYTTWGGDCFVIDLWQAKFNGRETTNRGLFKGTAHHYEHGIYRNPREHTYSRRHGPHLRVDQVFDM